jgi:hypothetical protein
MLSGTVRSSSCKPEEFILEIVEVDGETTSEPRYLRKPFGREPDFGVASVNYDLADLIKRGVQAA